MGQNRPLRPGQRLAKGRGNRLQRRHRGRQIDIVDAELGSEACRIDGGELTGLLSVGAIIDDGAVPRGMRRTDIRLRHLWGDRQTIDQRTEIYCHDAPADVNKEYGPNDRPCICAAAPPIVTPTGRESESALAAARNK